MANLPQARHIDGFYGAIGRIAPYPKIVMAQLDESRHNNATMPKKVSEKEFSVVLGAVAKFISGATLDDLDGALKGAIPRRTLQRRLANLVGGRSTGENREWQGCSLHPT